jgi:hypothetical protein
MFVALVLAPAGLAVVPAWGAAAGHHGELACGPLLASRLRSRAASSTTAADAPSASNSTSSAAPADETVKAGPPIGGPEIPESAISVE